MGGLETQVNGRRDGRVRGEEGVGELEEGVFAAVEAFVERAAETDKSIGRFGITPRWRTVFSYATATSSIVACS